MGRMVGYRTGGDYKKRFRVGVEFSVVESPQAIHRLDRLCAERILPLLQRTDHVSADEAGRAENRDPIEVKTLFCIGGEKCGLISIPIEQRKEVAGFTLSNIFSRNSGIDKRKICILVKRQNSANGLSTQIAYHCTDCYVGCQALGSSNTLFGVTR